MNKLLLVIAVLLVSLPFIIFTGQGFDSATVDRTSGVNIAADNNAVVTLTPSTSYGLVKLDASDELSISSSNVGASSFNRNMYLQLGSPSDPSADYAFTMNNSTSRTVDITMSFTKGGSFNDDATDRVIYTIEDSGGNITSFTEDTSTTVTLSAGETAYVAVELDARNISSGTLNGTVNIDST